MTLTDQQKDQLHKLLLEYKGKEIPDKKVHNLADDFGMSPHDLESYIYSLASQWVMQEDAAVNPGGRAEEKGVTEADFDKATIDKGIEVELEHTRDKDLAKKIVLDHLAESPDYYKALEKMEGTFEKESGLEAAWGRGVKSYMALVDNPGAESRAQELLTALLGRLKALFWSHWTAHWTTAGGHFYGDHLLFERLKDAVYEEIDQVAETAMGYFGASSVNPWAVMDYEHEGMESEGSVVSLVEKALGQERGFLDLLKTTLDTLEQVGATTPGLDDLLSAMARTHDSHVYLLQQRSGAAGEMGRQAYFNSLERSWEGQSSFRPTRHAEEGDEWLEAAGPSWDEWVAAGLVTED